MAKAPREKRVTQKAHQANIAEKKSRKHKGNAPGSRHSEPSSTQTHSNQAKADPRLGSKKLIALKKPVSGVEPQPKYFSPSQELTTIEQDSRLEKLLDKMERNLNLSTEEQQYVETKLARHHQLCELLGVEEAEKDKDAEQDSNNDEEALLNKFINSDIKDHKP